MGTLSQLCWLRLPLAPASTVVAATRVSTTPITTSPARRPRRFSCSRHSPLDVPQLASLPTTNFRSPSWRCSLLAGVEILRCCAARTSDHDHCAWVRPNALPSRTCAPNCWCCASDRTNFAERGHGGEMVEGGVGAQWDAGRHCVMMLSAHQEWSGGG